MNGNYLDIKLEELNLQRVESFEDTFEIFSCYLDALVYRTNDHNKLELAQINILKNLSLMPCQICLIRAKQFLIFLPFKSIFKEKIILILYGWEI